MKTFSAKPGDADRQWYVVDADDKVLGRLAARIATVLTGKHKPIYTPHVDTGDYVIVTNASKVRVTGKKAENKMYYRYSGYPGGLRETPFSEKIKSKPTDIIRHAVRGMMPKNKLSRQMIKKLKLYAGPDHPHEAQQPDTLEI
ncbi:MAG: 50S ribosomal protein L13 [Planctomycetes bacterium]|jgi:large subunit ribosomal protein L13|nr:50S ribosomal protein L13 [Planctomycetota bacterium]